MWVYMGVVIYLDRDPGRFTGAKLPYSARLDSGEGLAADTLAGIKQMIKDKLPAKITRREVRGQLAKRSFLNNE